ncbi:hypothetical protein FXO37_20172 [Capsicum annuum]|nr:hypothetical protein FXO37_20172 [Capsicum annuum]
MYQRRKILERRKIAHTKENWSGLFTHNETASSGMALTFMPPTVIDGKPTVTLELTDLNQQDRDEILYSGPYTMNSMPLLLKIWSLTFDFQQEFPRTIPLWAVTTSIVVATLNVSLVLIHWDHRTLPLRFRNLCRPKNNVKQPCQPLQTYLAGALPKIHWNIVWPYQSTGVEVDQRNNGGRTATTTPGVTVPLVCTCSAATGFFTLEDPLDPCLPLVMVSVRSFLCRPMLALPLKLRSTHISKNSNLQNWGKNSGGRGVARPQLMEKEDGAADGLEITKLIPKFIHGVLQKSNVPHWCLWCCWWLLLVVLVFVFFGGGVGGLVVGIGGIGGGLGGIGCGGGGPSVATGGRSIGIY